MSESSTALTPRRGSSSAAPLYDLRLNPPYLVDYTSACAGRYVATTKPRVRFRFGFSDAKALASGAAGSGCRGSEHDVTFVWSLASGKRLVVADGREVHFSVGKPTQGKFQFTWSMRGNHVLKIIGHAAPPLQARAGWRQFDLQLDGLSVFDMPKIFELGMSRGDGGYASALALVPRDDDRMSREGRYSGGSSREERYSGGSSREERPRFGGQTSDEAAATAYGNYALPSEEEIAWARRVEEHENRRRMDKFGSDASDPSARIDDDRGPRRQRQPADLGDMNPPPTPRRREERQEASVEPAPAPAPVPLDLVSDPTAVAQDLMNSQVAVLDEAPSAQRDDFTPRPPQPAPAPTYEDVSSSIMSGYGQAPPQQQQDLSALPPSTTYEQQQAQAQQQQQPLQQYYHQQVAPAAPDQMQQNSPLYEYQSHYYEYYAREPYATASPVHGADYNQHSATDPCTLVAAYGEEHSWQQRPESAAPPDEYRRFDNRAPAASSAPLRNPVDAGASDLAPPLWPPAGGNGAVPRRNADLAPSVSVSAGDSPRGADNVDDVGGALRALVNLEDISLAPEESRENGVRARDPIANAFVEKNVLPWRGDEAKGAPKSRGIAPVRGGWALRDESLAEVRAATASQKHRQPAKEAMKTHAFDPAAGQAGMLLVYGQPPPPQQVGGHGPPLLHGASGFGVGAHLPADGYGVYTQ